MHVHTTWMCVFALYYYYGVFWRLGSKYYSAKQVKMSLKHLASEPVDILLHYIYRRSGFFVFLAFWIPKRSSKSGNAGRHLCIYCATFIRGSPRAVAQNFTTTYLAVALLDDKDNHTCVAKLFSLIYLQDWHRRTCWFTHCLDWIMTSEKYVAETSFSFCCVKPPAHSFGIISECGLSNRVSMSIAIHLIWQNTASIITPWMSSQVWITIFVSDISRSRGIW